MSCDINKLELQLTNEFKKLKKKTNEFPYFYKIYITDCKYNNNYLIYIKNKYPYNGPDLYIGYINYINRFCKIDKKYIKIIKKYLF
jgi:hypothetical protein|tara:strand:+ start:488 stop:745 length:258 start_codon:yes stop_codon:yes gene_type:complete